MIFFVNFIIENLIFCYFAAKKIEKKTFRVKKLIEQQNFNIKGILPHLKLLKKSIYTYLYL